jgi:ATP-dependent DNA helicase RecQ
MGRYAKSREYFNNTDIASELQRTGGVTSKYQAEILADILLNSMYAFDRLMRKANNFYNRFLKFDESRNAYHFLNTGYAGFLEWLTRETANLFKENPGRQLNANEFEVFDPKVFGQNQEKRFLYLGLMEAMGLLLYQINGGECPEIYIRVNSRAQLERTVNQPAAYRNSILNNVHMRHEMSVEMLRYLFEKEANTLLFWELIEDYFLGKVPDEVTQRLAMKH